MKVFVERKVLCSVQLSSIDSMLQNNLYDTGCNALSHCKSVTITTISYLLTYNQTADICFTFHAEFSFQFSNDLELISAHRELERNTSASPSIDYQTFPSGNTRNGRSMT